MYHNLIDLKRECGVYDGAVLRCSPRVIEKAKHVCDKLGVGSSQPRLHFDNNDEVLLEVLCGNIIEPSYIPQRFLFPVIEETISAPFLAVVRSPFESRRRNVQWRIGLNCRF